MFQATIAACLRVLGSGHPNTLLAEHNLDYVRSQMRAEKPTKRELRGNAAARRKERATSSLLSPTAQSKAEAKTGAAEAELLAMVELERGVAGSSKCKATGTASKGKRS